MPIHVHILSSPDAEALSYLETLLDPGITITHGTSYAEFLYDVLVAGRPEPVHLEHSGNLRALVIPFSGLPEETRLVLKEYPELKVYNLHHNALATAETAFALLFAAAKGLVRADRELRAGDWTSRYTDLHTPVLHGKTALVLGYGAVGREVGRMCRGIGMQVVGVRRSGSVDDGQSGVVLYPVSELEALLPSADVLFICTPLTANTSGMVDGEMLALLPPGAILINVGRGDVVDEEALFEALRTRKLYAAGLDVWWKYPASEASRTNTLPSRSPFHELDNVVMSPHRGGASEGVECWRVEHLARLLNAIVRGDPIPNAVDLRRGY
jgi:phosphoglycerate dehydrogenase-like enzyme